MTLPGINTQNQSRFLAAAPSRIANQATDRVKANTAVANRVQQQAVANRVAPNNAVANRVNIAA